MEFFAQIQGGIGPDVWDKEVFISAADFLDAAAQANYKADELGGQVTTLEQCDCSEDEAMSRMVSRFLCWKLPHDFAPDAGISFQAEYNVEYMAKQGKPPCRHEPTGTNLLNAEQAKQMLRHVLGVL